MTKDKVASGWMEGQCMEGKAKAKGKGKRMKDVARLDGWMGARGKGEAHPPSGEAEVDIMRIFFASHIKCF